MRSSSIIQRILRDHCISNFNIASDERKLEVYKLALGKIRDGLAARKPRDVAKATLVTYEDALNVISVGLQHLKTTQVGRRFKLDKVVIPEVDMSLVYVGRALYIADEKNEKNIEYQECITRLRGKIFDACSYL